MPNVPAQSGCTSSGDQVPVWVVPTVVYVGETPTGQAGLGDGSGKNGPEPVSTAAWVVAAIAKQPINESSFLEVKYMGSCSNMSSKK